MHNIVAALFLIILLCEGWLLCRLILARESATLISAFALPLAALSNVLIVFVLTLFAVPLSPWSIGSAHVLILAVIGAVLLWKRRNDVLSKLPWHQTNPQPASTIFRRIAIPLCVLALGTQFLFSFSHAAILPTYQIDSLTNWTMRSKISFYDRAIAFDRTEDRGMAKPQYPILFHALQITAEQGQVTWSDRAANVITWLLSVSVFVSAFLLLRQLRGTLLALLLTTILTGIPILSLHLAQGYGDIHLVGYLLLSLLTIAVFQQTGQLRWHVCSGLFLAASVWTKSEALTVGLVPWIALSCFHWVKHPTMRHGILLSTLLVLLLSIPYPLFLLWMNLPLTPHATDAVIGWHPEGILPAIDAIFFSGSFGILWYAIVAGILMTALLSPRRIFTPEMCWGLFALALILFTYLCTPNVVFLLNGQSFHRQLMIPATFLAVATGIHLYDLLFSSKYCHDTLNMLK